MTFADLRTSIEDWATRSDFPDSVYSLTTARINRKLRVLEMHADYSGTITGETVALPDRFLQWDYLYIDTDRRQVLTMGDSYEQTRRYIQSGLPTNYFISGGQMHLKPGPDNEYDLRGVYFEALEPFANATDTNAVLEKYPEIYTYGCLQQVFLWDQDDANASKYLQAFDAMIKEANDADMMARFSGPLKMRPAAHA